MLERARSVVARHLALSAWFLTAAVLFAFLYALTKSLDFGLIAALFGAGLLTASAERFMLIPTPLDRRQWLMRLPVLNRIARAAHWLNPLYVGTFALVSPFPRDACRARLRLALTGAAWALFASVAVVLSIVGAVVLVLSRLPLSWKRLAQVQETHLYLELLRTTVEAEPLDPTTAGAR